MENSTTLIGANALPPTPTPCPILELFGANPCLRCGADCVHELCADCAFETATPSESAGDDDPFDNGSDPAPLEVVERCAHELEVALTMGESDAREMDTLGSLIRNLSGTLEAVRRDEIALGRLPLMNLLRQLNAACGRLAYLWKTIEFELCLDREELLAS